MDANHEEESDREEENDIFNENHFSQGSLSTTATTKKQKRLTSEAWKHFDRYEKVVDGLTVWKARCKYCKHEYCGNSASSGTGSLMRHATKCRVKHSGVNLGSSSQSTLHFTPDGKVTTWRYDPKVWRESLVVLTAVCDLPIYFGESSACEKHIKTSFNPSFQTVSARTIRRDITEYFGKRVAALKDEFGASKHCVALTSDIWDSRAHLDYSSVVAHYIDASWTLQKRILGFRLVDRHTGEIIAESIVEVLTDYGLLDRTISITLDNATANAKAMRFLDEPLKTYNAGFVLHQRCGCHIINLIVQAGLESLEYYVGNVRKVVSWIWVSNQRINAFKAQCISVGLKPRILDVDMTIRWNSTYLMLQRAAEYKHPLSQYLMTAQMQASSRPPAVLTFYDWEVVDKIVKFLEVFYKATNALSGSYYPTSPLALHQLLIMAHNLYAYKDDEQFGGVVEAMKCKYLDYWATPPMLYCLAFILDPRAKMAIFEGALKKIRGWMGLAEDPSVAKKVETTLFGVYANYDSKYGGLRVRPQANDDDDFFSWNLLGTVGPSSSGHKDTGDGGKYYELKHYLHTNFGLSDDRGQLNLLQWWEGHKSKYPVLSQLTKDLYSILVSTVSSESAFSMAWRIVEERRARLTPEIVEMLTLIKDWELQYDRIERLGPLEDYFIDELDEEDDTPTPTPTPIPTPTPQ